MRLVANGVRPAEEAASKDETRRAVGLPSCGTPIAGVFSRLAPWKGQHVFLKALAHAPDVHGLVVGSALFGEDLYADGLQKEAEALGLSRRLTFLGQRSDVSRLIRAVDIVVHPSVAPEPFGLTLVEAMHAGTPVIATAAGASAEILESGKAGLLVPPGDADALATAMHDVLRDGTAAKQRIEVARERAAAVYGVLMMQRSISSAIAHAATGARK